MVTLLFSSYPDILAVNFRYEKYYVLDYGASPLVCWAFSESLASAALAFGFSIIDCNTLSVAKACRDENLVRDLCVLRRVAVLICRSRQWSRAEALFPSV
jgi:hypothetical protein